MKKHILPIGSLVLVIVVIGYLLYQYFEKGVVTGDGWETLVMIIGLNMIHTSYWKEYFKK